MGEIFKMVKAHEISHQCKIPLPEGELLLMSNKLVNNNYNQENSQFYHVIFPKLLFFFSSKQPLTIY